MRGMSAESHLPGAQRRNRNGISEKSGKKAQEAGGADRAGPFKRGSQRDPERPPKGLLSGLYELPNLSGHLKQEEVLEYLKKEGFSPLHIRKLPEAKHIFSHVEWQMIGYQVRLEDRENDQKESFLFVEPERLEQEYPIPSAFAAYVDFLRKKK